LNVQGRLSAGDGCRKQLLWKSCHCLRQCRPPHMHKKPDAETLLPVNYAQDITKRFFTFKLLLIRSMIIMGTSDVPQRLLRQWFWGQISTHGQDCKMNPCSKMMSSKNNFLPTTQAYEMEACGTESMTQLHKRCPKNNPWQRKDPSTFPTGRH